MRLGGWSRLLIALALLWGVAVAVGAYTSRPNIQAERNAWASDGISLMASKISEAEHVQVEPWQIADKNDFSTTDKAITFFERVESKPTLSQLIFLDELKATNTVHRRRLAEIERERPTYIAEAFAVWLAPLVCLLLLGYGARWIWLGFRPKQIATAVEK